MKVKHQRKPPLPLSAAALRAVERRGVARRGARDLYHTLMTIPLTAVLALLASVFILVNLLFGLVYNGIGGLAGGRGPGFGRAFFFSVQTFSTTGYGDIYPITLAANLVSSGEIMLGLLGTATATGVLFARLSRPQARVLFSEVMIIRPYQGGTALMFRLINERRSQITEARISLTITVDEPDEDGGTLRRMITLPLERDTSPVFALSWVVIHRITPGSPLYGKDVRGIAEAGNVLICSFAGIDDTLNSNIYKRHIYGAEHLRFGHRFVDVIERGVSGSLSLDYRRLHDTQEI